MDEVAKWQERSKITVGSKQMASRTSPEIQSQDVSSGTRAQASRSVATTARNENPKVSVVIPCYNGEKFIGDAIESVLNQTYQDFEIIVVDDGSTDNSKSVIEHYLVDDRVKFIQHQQNRGIPAARNAGIRIATGQYIAFLDQDDKWMRQKLQLQVHFFRNTHKDVDLLFGNIIVIDEYGRCLGQLPPNPYFQQVLNDKKQTLKKLFESNFIPSITVMLKRECLIAVGYFDERVICGADDYDLWMRIAGRFFIGYIDKILAVRLKHAKNYTNPVRMHEGELKIVNKIVQEYPLLKNMKRKKIARLHYSLGRHHQQLGCFTKARMMYAKSIANYPFLGLKLYLAYLSNLLNLRIIRR